jgi:hypothetical protein
MEFNVEERKKRKYKKEAIGAKPSFKTQHMLLHVEEDAM